jgi:hypothetical protein
MHEHHVSVTCTGGHATAAVFSYSAVANAKLAAELSKAIIAENKRQAAITVTVPGGYARAVVEDETEAEGVTLAGLLNAAILKASDNWRPSH